MTKKNLKRTSRRMVLAVWTQELKLNLGSNWYTRPSSASSLTVFGFDMVGNNKRGLVDKWHQIVRAGRG